MLVSYCSTTLELLTIQLSKATTLAKLSRQNPQTIVFNSTISSGVVDTDINLGGASIQGVLHKLAYHSVETGNGDGRFYLRNDIWR